MDLQQATALHLLDLRARSCSHHTLVQYQMVESRFRDWLEGTGRPPTISELTAQNVREFVAWLGAEHRDADGKPVAHGVRSLGAHLVALKALATFLTGEGA